MCGGAAGGRGQEALVMVRNVEELGGAGQLTAARPRANQGGCSPSCLRHCRRRRRYDLHLSVNLTEHVCEEGLNPEIHHCHTANVM